MDHKVGYHAMSEEVLLKAFGVNLSKGLSQNEVLARLKKFGPNKLGKSQQKSSITISLDQCKSLLTALLAVAALPSFALGDISEGVAILIVISINISIGYWAESKAQRSMAALREMGRAKTKVLRGGKVSTIPGTGVVMGRDLVLMIKMGIALAVAAIPEGLPIVATLAFGQLWHVFNMRGAKTTVTDNQIVQNLYVWAAIAFCTILILISLHWPPISSVLNIISPDQKGWIVIFCASLVPLIVGQTVKGKFTM